MKKFGSILLILIFVGLATIPTYADDIELFLTQVPPDALIVLDLSGSMRWTPAGGTMYISSTETCGADVAYYASSDSIHTKACPIDAYYYPPIYGSDTSCNGPYYINNTHPGYSTDCSRLAIAKRALFDLLDDNDDNIINSQDEISMGIRLGFMRFRDGDDTTGDYNAGNIRLGRKNTSGCTESTSTSDALGIGSSFIDIYNRINCETANSGTPLASSLNEAKLYLDVHKAGDNARECRKKFVILVTDGADTYACGCSDIYNCASEAQYDQYKRRREVVAKAKALFDAGYNVFVIGFGNVMPHPFKNTLNWAAYYGGTDNYLIENTGSTSGYNPASVTSCQTSSYTYHNLGDGAHYYATSNDPGEATLNGYAFIAEDSSKLSKAFRVIKKYIQEKSYSFTGTSIPSVRVLDQDTVYISSCETPTWEGNLKAYQLNSDGTLPVDPVTKLINASPIWDAGTGLKQRDPANRTIYTVVSGVQKLFNKDNVSYTDLAVANANEAEKLIKHVRGIDSYDLDEDGDTTEQREWKLGDIFHSNPVIVGEPSRFFEDVGFSGSSGFYENKKNRTKVILVGANDGVLHAFNANTGAEEWGFIPNSVLTNLQWMVSGHTYYVDSSPKVADVWFDDNGDNQKSASEWKTVLVCGLRKGGKQYFALDITYTTCIDETRKPQFLWEFPSQNKNYDYNTMLTKVGQSWSEPAIGRVKVESGTTLVEKWVAFIGGGFDYNNTVGKLFLVIDLKTGNVIKEFSGLSGMDYSFTASPTAVDTNFDGYIDKVYIGDLQGQMWVFDVAFDRTNNKSESRWNGKRLFTTPAGEKHSIYYQPTVSFDRYRKPWVYFGTGDREYPKDITNPAERFYAIRDDGLGNYPRTEADSPPSLTNVTSSNTFNPTSTKGWYIQLEKTSTRLEKVLARPAIFNRLVYFTTYTYSEASNPCQVAGDAKLYIVEYLSGGGAFDVDDMSDLEGTASKRSETIGAGVPSAPVISVNLSGKASLTVGTTSNQVFSSGAFSPSTNKEMLYWREVIPE